MAEVTLVRPAESPVGEAASGGAATPVGTRRSRRIRVSPAAAATAVLLGGVALALALSGGTPQAAPEGLPDAGAVTGWALPLVRGTLDLAAMGTIGSLLAAAFLVRTSGDRLDATGLRVLRIAGRWAWAWLAASVGLIALTTSDVLGRPLGEVARSWTVLRYAWQLPEGRALTAMALVALAIALNARTVRGRLGSAGLLVAAVLGMVPLLLAGHSAAAGNHYVATQGLLVHVLAATLWVGGLLGLLVVARTGREHLKIAVPRFSNLALVCFAAVAAFGGLTAWGRLGVDPDAWWSTYGALVGLKTLALVALGGFGLLHRRGTVARVVAGVPWAFARLAFVEVLVMAGTTAVAVVLSRTAPPVGAGLGTDSSHGGTVAAVNKEIDPLGVAQLLTEWRPDALVITAVVVAVVGYLLAVRHVRRLGLSWPVSRTAWAMSGLAVVLYTMCGALGSYGSATLSMQAAQLLTMLTVAPLLISLGTPVTLVRAVAGVEEWGSGRTARGLADPVNGIVLAVALLVGLYATPLFELSLRNPAVHLVVNLAALAVGLVVFRAILARDWLPVVRARGDRAALALVPAGLLLVLAAVVWRADGGYGLTWFENLNLWWTEPTEDRGVAAVVIAAFAVPMLTLSIVLARRPTPQVQD